MFCKLLIYHFYCLSPTYLPTLPGITVALQGRMLCVLLTLRAQCLERPGTRQVISYQDDVTRMHGRTLACL